MEMIGFNPSIVQYLDALPDIITVSVYSHSVSCTMATFCHLSEKKFVFPIPLTQGSYFYEKIMILQGFDVLVSPAPQHIKMFCVGVPLTDPMQLHLHHDAIPVNALRI